MPPELSGVFSHHAQEVPYPLVPVSFKQNLTALEREEVELEENVIRVDLDWREKAQALKRLHDLRTAQTGGTQTIAATASEVLGRQAQGDQVTRVSEAIMVAKHLDDPDVLKAKDQKEAVKILRKKAETAHRISVAATLAAPTSLHTIHAGDARTELKRLEPETFSVLITDPPYGIGADNFGDQATTSHEYEDSKKYFQELASLLAEESYRVCKSQAHAYIWCDLRNWDHLELQMTLAGWQVWPHPLIMLKKGGMLPQPELAPRRSYESILYAIKGKKPVLAQGLPDWLGPFGAVEDRVHGAQKPVDAYLDLLRRSARPGDSVLDPFAGSGTIFSAATKLHLVATGIELDPAQVANCKIRIASPEKDELDKSLDFAFGNTDAEKTEGQYKDVNPLDIVGLAPF